MTAEVVDVMAGMLPETSIVGACCWWWWCGGGFGVIAADRWRDRDVDRLLRQSWTAVRWPAAVLAGSAGCCRPLVAVEGHAEGDETREVDRGGAGFDVGRDTSLTAGACFTSAPRDADEVGDLAFHFRSG